MTTDCNQQSAAQRAGIVLARLAKRNFPLFSLSQMIFTVETPISTLITIKKASPTTTQQRLCLINPIIETIYEAS
jgi:hypothetical protein